MSDIDFIELQPTAPLYTFRIIDDKIKEHYANGFKIDSLSPPCGKTPAEQIVYSHRLLATLGAGLVCWLANIAKRVSNVVDVLKLAAQVEDFPPVTDRIALANGTLYLDGTFQEGKPEIVRNRLPVKYDPKAAQPVHWLRFLSDLLYPEDIPTVQEFIGYCLIPSNMVMAHSTTAGWVIKALSTSNGPIR